MVPLYLMAYQSYQNVTKYNAESLGYAKSAIQKLKAGAKSTKQSGAFGAFEFERSKDDAQVS